MTNEGIELEIYPYSNPKGSTKFILPSAKSPQTLSEMKGVGGGSFFLAKNDPRLQKNPTMLDSRNVCKIKADGRYIGAFLINQSETVIEGGVRGDQIAGEGLKIWFDDAQVEPHNGLFQFSGGTRYFNFASEIGEWYKPSQWTNPYVFATVKQTPIWGYQNPKDWPDAAYMAKWIWCSPYADPINPAPCYFRWSVNITTPGQHAIYTAVDDKYILYVDGQQVAKSSDKALTWPEASRIEVDLSEGPHTIAYMAKNNGDQPYNGPAALVAALFRVNGNGGEVLLGTSDIAGWKCMAYPTAPPWWTVGEILLSLLDEAEERGVLFPSYLTPTFTATHDSYGEVWEQGPEWAFGVGESYSSVVSKLEELYDIWIDPDDYQLHMVPTRGVNRTDYTYQGQDVIDTPVKFTIGKDIREASTQSRGKMKNALSLKTTEGFFKAKDDPSINKYGRLEGSLDTGTSSELANVLAGLVFVQRANEEEGASYNLVIKDKIPHRDFDIGDWVLAPNKRGETVPRRVMSISTEQTDSGKPVYTIEFDTIFRSNEERLNKIAEKMGGGGVGGGMSNVAGSTPGVGAPITLPPPSSGAIIQPKSPTNLVATSVGAWNAAGVIPISTVNLEWDPVTQYTDNTEFVVGSYEVWARSVTNPDTGWDMIGVTTTNSYEAQPFNPTDEWAFRVRALSTTGVRSDWSNTATEVMEAPATPLPAPDAPDIISSKGVLVITWNGQLDGNPPAPQFRYVYAEVAESEFGSYTRMGATLNREGRQLSVTGLTIGDEYWTRLRAVDGVGLISEPSVSVSHTVTGIDLGDLDESIQDAIDAATEAGRSAREQVNMLNDPSFELNTEEFWNYGTGVTNVTTAPRSGERSLRLQTAGTESEVVRYTRTLPCDPGESYYFRFYLRPDADYDPNALVLEVRSGETETLTDVTVVATSGELLEDIYTAVSGSWTAPLDTFFFSPSIRSLTTASGEIYFIDDMRVYMMTDEATLVNGSIVTDKLAADAITAEKIAAGAVAAEKIAAGAITAEKMAADSVTANAIAAGSIEANKIAAGAVQTNHIAPDVGGQLDISANDTVQIIAGRVDGVEGQANDTQDNLDVMQTYYSFGPTGAVVSSPGSVFALALRNDRIEMLENGNVVSYWNSGQMYVPQFVGERVTLGNHQIEKYEDGTVVRAL